MKKHWPLVALVLVLAIVSFYLIRSEKEVAPEPEVVDQPPGEGLLLKDIRFTQENPDEKLKWILDAKEVTFSEDRSSIVFRDFKLRMEPEDKPSFDLKGDKGDYAKDSGKMNLRGNLVGVSERGYRIHADHMLINEKSGHLSTDGPVKIFGPFFSVIGKGLFVDLGGERFKIMSDVTTTIKRESLVR